MKIFVTGADGFIGRAFCRAAQERGHSVLGLRRRMSGSLPAGCRETQGSVEDLPWPEIDAFAPEAVLHLAWPTPPVSGFDSPVHEAFAAASDALFRALAGRGVRLLTGAGTFIEYAPCDAPLVEDVSPLDPTVAYARAKAAVRERLEQAAQSAGAVWTWFRIFNAYGEGEPPERMTSSMMLTLSAGRPAVVNAPQSLRDYVHVSDVARGLVSALEYRLTGPVNIGSGAGVRVLDLVRRIAHLTEARDELVRAAAPPAADPMPTAIAGIDKLREIGWRPVIDLDEGLRRLHASLSKATPA